MKGSLQAAPVGVDQGSSMPGVEGALGVKPIVTVPKSAPPAEMVVQPIVTGTGSVVVAGQTLAGKVVGVTWTGREFVSTWDRESEMIAPGSGLWPPTVDAKLLGMNAGSRVLIIVPPSAGFGIAGNATMGIGPADTLVYVLDLFGSF
jgi:FKBP-type peptidyl-prolyl cis-trans isomerase